MLLSAFLSEKIAVVNLAWGRRYAHIKRPRWILQFVDAARLGDSEIVVFADGSDTIFTGFGPGAIAKKFSSSASTEEVFDPQEVARGNALPPLLFNAEANCYHQQTFAGSWGVKKGKCISAYKRHNPNVTSPYRYLNGGAWIGRVWALKKVFMEVKRRADADPSLWCDQSVLGAIYLSNAFGKMFGLDFHNDIFLPTYHLRIQRDFCDAPVPGAGHEPRMRMCHSGKTPSIIHFNGKSEGASTSEVIHRTAWWRQAQEQNNAVELMTHALNDGHTFKGDSGHPVKLGEVCKGLAFPP
jgi:hypothetical protein